MVFLFTIPLQRHIKIKKKNNFLSVLITKHISGNGGYKFNFVVDCLYLCHLYMSHQSARPITFHPKHYSSVCSFWNLVTDCICDCSATYRHLLYINLFHMFFRNVYYHIYYSISCTFLESAFSSIYFKKLEITRSNKLLAIYRLNSGRDNDLGQVKLETCYIHVLSCYLSCEFLTT